MNRALVYIEQEGQVTGVTFPSTPIVVSLLDYDNIDGAQLYPPRGYPLVCVTVSILTWLLDVLNASFFCHL